MEAAEECGDLSLDDGLAWLVVVAADDDLFERASRRWLVRFAAQPGSDPVHGRETRLFGALLYALPGFDEAAAVAAGALGELAEMRGMEVARDAAVLLEGRLG